MKIIYRYLIKNFLGPFVLTFLVSLFILLMQYLWKWVDELVGKGLEIHIILEFLFYAAASLVSMALPLAVLLSSLMTFGNLGERFEIVAIKSAGISISKMMIPLACVAFLISCFALWYSNDVIPKANVKLRTLLFDIQNQKPAFNIEEGVFYDELDNYSIRIGKKRNNELIEDVLLYDNSHHQGNTTMTYAEKGEMKMTTDKKYLLLTLYDGFYWDESKNQSSGKSRYPLSRATFKEQYKRFDMSDFQIQKSDEDYFKYSQQALPISKLKSCIDTMKMELGSISDNASRNFFDNLYYFNQFVRNNELYDTIGAAKTEYDLDSLSVEDKNKVFNYAMNASSSFKNSINFIFQDAYYKNLSLYGYQIELYQKFTLSLACLLFFFIGAPLGSIIRKGGIGIPLVITVLFFTFYFVLSIIGKNLAKGVVVPVVLGMWFSTFIITPICIFLTYKASVDSMATTNFTLPKWLKKFKVFKKKDYTDNENSSNMS